MGDLLLKCPLCCSEVFNSKQLLVDHLSKIWFNLRCPVCNDECSSIAHLIEHMNSEACVPKTKTEQVDSSSAVLTAIRIEPEECQTLEHQNVTDNQVDHIIDQSQVTEVTDVSRLYVELLSKQLAKPCLQTQELKLVKEDGESRYVIVTQSDSILKSGNTVFTKQNSDGTISLTTVKDMKVEPDPLLPEVEPEESQEIYSCNTCGVSFSSVIDHIQNYHNDQDVVVEESMDHCTLPGEYEPVSNEEVVSADQHTSRRVITDTGNIVEAPVLLNDNVEDNLPIQPMPTGQLVFKQENTKPTRLAPTEKRIVQVDSMVRNLKVKNDIKKGPYHKVVVKEMQMLEGGNKVKVYNCMTCNIYVTSLDEFKSHPCKSPKYQCPHCPVAYENSKSLSAHMKVHKVHTESETDNSGPFRCDICSTVFPSNKSLKLHKRMHDPVKARPIELPVETEGTEPSNDKFICSICDKLIPIDYRAVHHNSHKTDNKFNCDICNRKFHSSEYLEMHMSVHNVDKVPKNKQDKTLPYMCMYCSRQFARPHEKVKHERIHTGEKPHSCEICGKSFRVSYCLTLHMRTHTGARPYACPHCNKRFKAHSVYNHHLLTHSEVRAYKCPFCPKAFKTSVQLAGHKNSHTKPFSCQHCNRPFASLYAVRAHTETHARQNNLKFSCTLCGASYARTFALKDHIKQVHKQDMESIEKTTVELKEEGWILSEGDADATHVTLEKSIPNEINQLVINTNEAESVMVVP